MPFVPFVPFGTHALGTIRKSHYELDTNSTRGIEKEHYMTFKWVTLDQLLDRTYGVVIVDAGINGCRAAQAISADGYRV